MYFTCMTAVCQCELEWYSTK